MITIVFKLKGATTLQYEEACRLAEVSASNPPDGMVFHCAQETDYGMLVVDVWESEAKFERFGEVLAPAMQSAGIVGIPQIYPTHSVLGARADASV